MGAPEPNRGLRGPLLGMAAVLVIVVGVGLLSRAERRDDAWPETVRIATASPGGTYMVIGDGLARRVLARDPTRRVRRAEAWETSGSGDNVGRLVRGETELALVSSAVLQTASAEERAKIRALARLYDGYMQLVVRNDAGIEKLEDLAGKRIYVGKRGSGTEAIADEILAAAGLSDDWQRVGEKESFTGAATRLVRVDGGIDAAIFGGGIPTQAVSAALATETCRLLGLGDVAGKTCARFDGLIEETISKEFYRGQGEAVQTVVAPALLAARADLPAGFVEHVLTLLYDNVHGLLAHAMGQKGQPGVVAIEAIRVEPDHAFPPVPVPYHSGSLRFQEKERSKLLIATGSLGGRYHRMGLEIQRLLEQAGLPARATHTEGSFQNADLLRDPPQPTIAIMQYDAALATLWTLPGLRSIARLHEERMHILVRDEILEGLPEGEIASVTCLRDRRVCLGPGRSATERLARAILAKHGVAAQTVHLPFRDMQTRLDPREEGVRPDLDGGFFCGGRPSLALKELLREGSGIRLLAVEPDAIGDLTLEAALDETKFTSDESGAYGCLDGDVPTIATRAILVTTEDNPHVRTITRAVFQGAGMLTGLGEEEGGFAGIEQSMAAPLASLLPHPDAVEVYEERGLRLVPESRTIETIAGALGILAILVATYRGAQFLRRERLAEHIRGQVLEVSLAATTTGSSRRLMAIRNAVRERAQRKWWSAGGLSKKSWHELEAMIEERVAQARSTLCASLLGEARAVRHEIGAEAQAARDELRARIWQHAQEGELAELQVLLALRALGEESNEVHT